MKTVIITGASGNLGRATVEKFIQENFRVIATVEPGHAKGFYDNHAQVDVHEINLGDEAAVTGFVDQQITKYGRIDAALLLVGGYASGNLNSTEGPLLRSMYALNFETAYFMARPVFDHMMKQQGGKIILIGARPALSAKHAKGNVAYALAKSLLFRLAEILNLEGSGNNVTTTVIVPSTIDTPANRSSMPTADFSAWVKPEAIAETMHWVVSGKADDWRESVIKVYGKS